MNKTVAAIIIIVIACIIIFAGYNKFILQPNKRLAEKEEIIEELNETIKETAKNETGTGLITETKSSRGWLVLFIITTIIFAGLWIYGMKSGSVASKHKRHEIISHMIKYAEKHEPITIYKHYKFLRGFYKGIKKADAEFALVTFSTMGFKDHHGNKISTWTSNVEPPKEFHYGYLVSLYDLDDIAEDFPGCSLKEMFTLIRKAGFGGRGLHYTDIKDLSPENIALVEYMKETGTTERRAKELYPTFKEMGLVE